MVRIWLLSQSQPIWRGITQKWRESKCYSGNTFKLCDCYRVIFSNIRSLNSTVWEYLFAVSNRLEVKPWKKFENIKGICATQGSEIFHGDPALRAYSHLEQAVRLTATQPTSRDNFMRIGKLTTSIRILHKFLSECLGFVEMHSWRIGWWGIGGFLKK